jgi:hypothetical protein
VAGGSRQWGFPVANILLAGKGLADAVETRRFLAPVSARKPFSLSTLSGLVMLRLGLAWKPWLGLGSPGLWLHFPQAQAQAVEEGLAWLGFGLSRLASNFPQCIYYTFIAALLLLMQKMQLNVHIVVWIIIIRVLF